jgi:CRP/FNR family cyclic AMP-dependent transcriptional regulator
MTIDEIRAITLFDKIPGRRRTEVARLADRITVPAGKVITRQGDLAHEFFVIINGVADVIRDGRRVAQLGGGDFFGEIGLVGKPFRTATVVARSDLDVAVIARREFHTILRRFPDFASTVLSAGSRRIVATLQQIEAASFDSQNAAVPQDFA